MFCLVAIDLGKLECNTFIIKTNLDSMAKTVDSVRITERSKAVNRHWHLTLGLQTQTLQNKSEKTYQTYQLHHNNFDVTWISVFEGFMPQTPKG